MTAKGPGSQPLHAVPVLGGDDHKRTKTATQGDLWGGARTWLIGAWALLAGLPMLVAALVFAIKQPVLLIDGDGASNEFALINAGHFAQLVGNYSRYGWFHPGPAWFYALDLVYQPLGAQTWAFIVAYLVLNAVTAGLIVVVAWRSSRSGFVAMLTCGLLACYVNAIGAMEFRTPWPPYSVILPMPLFLLLAGLGTAGSNAAVVGAMLVGSFEIQADIGTTPTVGLVGIAMLVARLLGDRLARSRPRFANLAPGSRGRLSLPLGILALIAMWLPTMVNQFTVEPGNLTSLWTFFTLPHPKHHLLEAVSAAGRLLTVFPFGPMPHLFDTGITSVSTGYIAAYMAFVVACVGLVVAGIFASDRFAQSLGIVVAVAAGGLVISGREIVGSFYPYLVLGSTTLPLVLAIGWLSLAAKLQPWSRLRWRPLLPQIARPVVAISIVILIAAQVPAFLTLPPIGPGESDTPAAWRMTQGALAGEPKGAILLEIDRLELWPLAAGLALQLDKSGRPTHVAKSWTLIFGSQALATGEEPSVLTITPPGEVQSFERMHAGARLLGVTSTAAIFVRKRQDGAG
jgi:hypothetical protein